MVSRLSGAILAAGHGARLRDAVDGLPKPLDRSPVVTFNANSFGPAVKRILGGLLRSPPQNATPRAVVALPFGSSCRHSSLPVSASSARIRLPADGRYITPSMTIGVASGLLPASLPSASAPRPGAAPP